MIGPDLQSSAFQVLSALAVTEHRSARGNMAPVAKAFHNQQPQAIAATGFPQPAATGHCSHRLSTTSVGSRSSRQSMRGRDLSRGPPPCHRSPFVERKVVIVMLISVLSKRDWLEDGWLQRCNSNAQ